jgi:hypothetical protein
MFSDEDLTKAVEKDGIYPRSNFNNFLNGFITIFIVFIGEDWNVQMYNHYRATGLNALFFFVFLFVLGNLILLNLFLAILLDNFDKPPGKDEEEEESSGPKVSFTSRLKRIFCCCCTDKEEIRKVHVSEMMTEIGKKITLLKISPTPMENNNNL